MSLPFFFLVMEILSLDRSWCRKPKNANVLLQSVHHNRLAVFITTLFMRSTLMLLADQFAPAVVNGKTKKRLRAKCPKSFRIKVPKRGLEPPRGLPPLAPQASASAIPPLGLDFESVQSCYTDDRNRLKAEDFPV